VPDFIAFKLQNSEPIDQLRITGNLEVYAMKNSWNGFVKEDK